MTFCSKKGFVARVKNSLLEEWGLPPESLTKNRTWLCMDYINALACNVCLFLVRLSKHDTDKSETD